MVILKELQLEISIAWYWYFMDSKKSFV